MDEYRKANQALWDEYVRLHEKSEFYDVRGFRAGRITLNPMELEEIGDVTGRSLLHLQCHFGLDTLSWARLGAKVTGVDFSEEAIDLATRLNQELDLDAVFVCSDIYELPEVLEGQYDIVYTSHGVLTWLPDLERWAQVIAHFLKPGGIFYIAETHPFGGVFEEDPETHALKVLFPYFPADHPMRYEVDGSYADPVAKIDKQTSYEWPHSLGEILNSLIGAGLKIRFFHEYPFNVWAQFPNQMEKCEDGVWRLKEGNGELPLLFSLKALKE